MLYVTFHLQLFCSFCATFTLHIFASLSEGGRFGYLKLGSPGLVDFGTFGTVSCIHYSLQFKTYLLSAFCHRMRISCGMPTT